MLNWLEAESKYPGCSAAFDVYINKTFMFDFVLIETLYAEGKAMTLMARAQDCLRGKFVSRDDCDCIGLSTRTYNLA